MKGVHAMDRGRRLWMGGAAATAALAPVLAFAAGGEEVTASEDLMREHGIIRRMMLVYTEAAGRLRSNPREVPLRALGDTARLMREFGEDYHERALEEKHIFPLMRKAKGPIAQMPDVLEKQHDRGREITGYVLRASSAGRLDAQRAAALAGTLDAFVFMYAAHAAREDTDLFPAWKSVLGKQAYGEMGERFEEIERKTFGGDGFEMAHRRIERIEAEFGLSDLARLTAPPPEAGANPHR